MDIVKRSGKVILIIISSLMSTCIVAIIGHMLAYEMNNTAQNSELNVVTEAESTAETTQAGAKNKDNQSVRALSVEIYAPTKFDNKANATYYVVVKNNQNRHFEGSFRLSNIATSKETDKVGFAKLDPHEAVLIPCSGQVPDKSTNIGIESEGSFSGEEFIHNTELTYTIVRQEVSGHRNFVYIYTPPNMPDANYIEICKEIKHNYQSYKMLIARFAPVMVNPNNNDSIIVYTNNQFGHFSHAVFYDDVSNSRIIEDERKVIDI